MPYNAHQHMSLLHEGGAAPATPFPWTSSSRPPPPPPTRHPQKICGCNVAHDASCVALPAAFACVQRGFSCPHPPRRPPPPFGRPSVRQTSRHTPSHRDPAFPGLFEEGIATFWASTFQARCRATADARVCDGLAAAVVVFALRAGAICAFVNENVCSREGTGTPSGSPPAA